MAIIDFTQGIQEQISFQFSDFMLKRSDAQGMMNNIPAPILATGNGLTDPNVVHLFDSEEAFADWARMTRLAPKFAKIDELARNLQIQNRIACDEILVANGREHTVVSNEDLILPASAGFAQTDDLAVVYENAEFGGRSHTLEAGAMPNLSMLGLFNQISSVRVSGICLLTDRTWFHGARLYLVGAPMLEVSDLKAWGFNNRAASAIVM